MRKQRSSGLLVAAAALPATQGAVVTYKATINAAAGTGNHQQGLRHRRCQRRRGKSRSRGTSATAG